MDPSQYVVRRANVDDLAGLKVLWERSALQVLELERHVTEFQVISSLQGDLIGAAGLRIAGKHGLIHSEAFTQPETEDEFRPLLWQRLSTLARNHGLVRIWTREQAPFWHQAGFVDADPDALRGLPAAFGDPNPAWRSLRLRDENAPGLTLDQEFELFQQASRASTEEVLSQARRLRAVAYTIAVIIFAIAAAVGVFLAYRSARSNHRPPAVQQL